MASILNLKISQGSVATHFRWGGSLYYRIHSTFPLESFSEKIINRLIYAKVVRKHHIRCPVFFWLTV